MRNLSHDLETTVKNLIETLLTGKIKNNEKIVTKLYLVIVL